MRTVVGVVFVPTGMEYPPPLVSLVAEHAGAFVAGTVNVIVHVLVALAPVPSVTLPPASLPTILAPAPQSAPSVGVVVCANAAPEQSRKPTASRRQARRILALLSLRCIFI